MNKRAISCATMLRERRRGTRELRKAAGGGAQELAGWVALRRLTRSGGCRRRRAGCGAVRMSRCCTDDEGEENPSREEGVLHPRNTWSQFSVHYRESLGVPPLTR
jgi:hypothetical protein